MDNPKSQFNRRDFLKLTGYLVLAVSGSVSILQLKNQDFDSNPFTLGVASGSPMSDGFVLWTRLDHPQLPVDQDLSVRWRLWSAENTIKPIREGSAVALAVLAHSVHVELTDLPANSWYHYEFEIAGYKSIKGRARTLPEQSAKVTELKLAYASCQRYEDGYFSAYRHLAQQNPDLVCFTGDYIYEYASRRDAIRHHQLGRIRNLADYRARYALYKSDVDLQSLHATCPWLIIWDDHEVENNYFGISSAEGRGDISTLRAAAYQAFYEHMPIRASAMTAGLTGLLQGVEFRIYQHLNYGSLASIYLLDNRQYRSAPICDGNPESTLSEVCSTDSFYRTMLGSEQENWLESQLYNNKSQAWQILIQQTRFSPANYHLGLGQGGNRDTWDGYPEARQKILTLLSRHSAGNATILGGDIHQNWVARVHQNPYDTRTAIIATEFCGTSITSRSNTASATINRHLRRNPHLLYANAADRGYGLAVFSAEKLDVSLFGVDDITNPQSKVTLLTQFTVPRGAPQQITQH